ncbi:MAG: type IV secretion system DNA-binding domain-containing protein [Thermoproteota archaeon]
MNISLDDLRSMQRVTPEPGKNPVTYLGYGIYWPDFHKETFITIPDSLRSGHIGVFGTTRVGKTRLMENLIEQDIKKGYNLVIIDPKGDVELFSKVVSVAALTGRLDDLMLLTPIYPQYSIKLDPLSHYYMEDELVDHVISGIKAREDYFISVAQEITTAVVSSLALQAKFRGQRLNISFADVKAHIGQEDLLRLKTEIAALPGSAWIVHNIDQILKSPQDFFAKVTSSLRTTLSALTWGSIGEILGRVHTNEFIERIEHGRGVILFCNTGNLLARRAANIVGRVLVSMIQSLAGRYFASGRKFSPPLCLHIDEGHSVLYSGISDLFSKGGGANVWICFYTQSIAQMEDAVSQANVKGVLDNINTWLFMLVNHPETAKYVEDSFPTVIKNIPLLSFGRDITVRRDEKKLVTAEQVLQLPKRRFYMRSYGTYASGITLDTSQSLVNVSFPHIVTVEHDAPGWEEIQ